MSGAVIDPSVLDPARAACSAITGYLYQAAWGVLRWIDLEDDQLLLCEGDEDLDRRLRGDTATGVSEQVKHYQKLDRRAFREILANFVRGYVALQREGAERRYLLTASCNRYDVGEWADLMNAWGHADHAVRAAAMADIAVAVDNLLREGSSGPTAELADCLEWLGETSGQRWAGFVGAVEWNFGAPSLDSVLAEIERSLRDRTSVPTAVLGSALLSEVLAVSARPNPVERVLTLASLNVWLENRRHVLDHWAEGQTARWLQGLLDRDHLLATKIWSVEPGAELLPGQMVQAQYQQVRFDDSIRQQELALLTASCADTTKRVDILVLTGEGGSGKTRLMIEWCRRQRDQGWQAGFLADKTTDELSALLLAPGPPRLLVVDYAESRVAEVEQVLNQIHGRMQTGDCPLVRVVLLARQEGPWWQALREDSPTEVRDLMRRLGTCIHEVQTLPDSPETRAAQYLLARESFRPRYPQAAMSRPVDLRDTRFRNVLLMHMKALLDLTDHDLATAEDVLHTFLLHEADYWRKAMEQQRPPLSYDALRPPLRRCLALLTLAGGTDANAEQRLKAIIRIALANEEDSTVRGAVYHLIGRLYGVTKGPKQGILHRPLEPDLLGEQLVWEEYSVKGEDLASHVLQLRPDEQAAAFWLLARLCSRQIPAIPLLETVLKTFVANFDYSTVLPETRLAILGALDTLTNPTPHFARALALALTEDNIDRLAQSPAATSTHHAHSTYLNELARLKNNLGNRLSDLGQIEDALAANSEAVDIRRSLVALEPEVYQSELAMSLNNLGNRLSESGQRKDALAVTAEAVTLYRSLVVTWPDNFRSELAASLNNMVPKLIDLGRIDDALAAISEAVELYRSLAADRTHVFRSDLAMSLNNLGGVHSELGNHEGALAASAEAAEHYRCLAAARPDAYRPDLAMSLNNLGGRLRALGRHDDALAATAEAVDIYRGLSAVWPDAFRKELAGSLISLGNRLSALRKHDDAVAAMAEAVEIQRDLAAAWPDAFLPDLALSLNGLGNRLSALQRHNDAVAATAEAVEIRRSLAAVRPDAFLLDLASSLNALGNRLSALQRHDDAVTATAEAVEIRRSLAATRPDAFLPDLALSLNNLGARYNALEQWEQALSATNEAIEIRRGLAAARPDAFLPDLALSLYNLGAVLRYLGRREDALAAEEEALRTIRGHFQQSSHAYAKWTRGMVSEYLRCCQELERRPDSDLLDPIVARLQELNDANP